MTAEKAREADEAFTAALIDQYGDDSHFVSPQGFNERTREAWRLYLAAKRAATPPTH